MPVNIESTRFGAIEVPEHAMLEFPNGLIGLGGTRYTLIAREESAPFLWLHSLDDASLAIPVTNPWFFFSSYAVEISDAEAERIGVTDPSQADVYVTVRAGETIEDFRANLRAPILVAGGRGHQVINEAGGTSVRAPLFEEVAAVEQVA
ncbi:MAG: flagellar assembly factor FliW [Thermoleophilaceae bacterium]|jgi:flagellar assembly factor FliW|nr:flagellar assembly factor FliW [Thermoleophilaceae bacterium]